MGAGTMDRVCETSAKVDAFAHEAYNTLNRACSTCLAVVGCAFCCICHCEELGVAFSVWRRKIMVVIKASNKSQRRAARGISILVAPAST